MPSLCSAHDGCVTMMVGASEVIKNTYSKDKDSVFQSALLSYGRSDNRLHVWAIALNEESFTLSLHLLMSVKMTAHPRFIALMRSTVCVALDTNDIVMFNTPSNGRRGSKILAFTESLDKMSLMHHQEEEEHNDNVTFLTVSSYLGLFASSSIDGMVKVWDTQNMLVSEMDFGEPVTSVGFANFKGDLLIGIRLHISMILAEDYLPDQYIQIVRDCPFWDLVENPLPFDPQLKFWLVF